jgi:Uma2 family endonuclease
MLDPFYLDPDLGIDLDRIWTEREYLEFGAARGLEFVNGTIEVLPMPTIAHQMMLALLYDLLSGHVKPRKLGMVLFAGLRVRTEPRRYREPDLAFLRSESLGRMDHLYWNQADLVMEIVSDHDRRRDLHTKRHEYARAGIPEYWIVDPRDESVTVLTLGVKGKPYTVHGIFQRGRRATSVCLPGFEVDVAELFSTRSPIRCAGRRRAVSALFPVQGKVRAPVQGHDHLNHGRSVRISFIRTPGRGLGRTT